MDADLHARQTLGRDYWRAVGVATAATVAVVAVLYAAGQALQVSMEVTPIGSPKMTISAGWALGESLAASLLGGTLAWLLARFTRHPRGIFLGIAWVVLILLSISAATAGEDSGTITVLLLMHLGVLIPTLSLVVPRIPTSRRQRRTTD